MNPLNVFRWLAGKLINNIQLLVLIKTINYLQLKKKTPHLWIRYLMAFAFSIVVRFLFISTNG